MTSQIFLLLADSSAIVPFQPTGRREFRLGTARLHFVARYQGCCGLSYGMLLQCGKLIALVKMGQLLSHLHAPSQDCALALTVQSL